MDGRELSDRLNYAGMERAVRKLAVDEKLATAEEIAVMTTHEVCDLVSKTYKMVYAESEEIGLVRNKDLLKYNELVTVISR